MFCTNIMHNKNILNDINTLVLCINSNNIILNEDS